MFGSGIVKGLGVTMKRFFAKKVTIQYPEVKPNLPSRAHGSFAFEFEKCISCNMCADACPNAVIRVDFTKDEKGKRMLQQYNMNLGYCLFCGLCVKACPKDAVYFKTDFDMVCYDKTDAVYVWKKPVVSEIKVEETKADEAKTDIKVEGSVQVKSSEEGLGV
jgi:NADH-quinone oxidoreductase subunit I